MNYIERINYRITEEGISNTIKYIIYVACDTIRKAFQDAILDIRYSGRLLDGNHKSAYKHLGANDVYHTAYPAMPLIFRYVTITPEDVLVDVGCGKGRVINYWLNKKYNNKIVGLELDPEIARQTAAQFARRKNVSIVQGDAIANFPHDGTIFYFYNPFCEEKVIEFEKLAARISENRPIKIIYYNPKSIYAFTNNNWEIAFIDFERDLGVKRWGRLNKYHELAIITRKHG